MKQERFDLPKQRVFTAITGITVVTLLTCGILNLLYLNFMIGTFELILSLSLFLFFYLIIKKHIYGISILKGTVLYIDQKILKKHLSHIFLLEGLISRRHNTVTTRYQIII